MSWLCLTAFTLLNWPDAELPFGFFCWSGTEDIRHLRGSVVTQLCLDYGMIDDVIYFTSGEVLGGTPVKVGDLVNGVAVRDGAQGGWKALRVRIVFFSPASICK